MAALAKARYGFPCNGCGLCCMATLCPLGSLVFKQGQGPCPALHQHGIKYTCGLVEDPARYRPDRAHKAGVDKLRKGALLLIGSNMGCDSLETGEPDNPKFRHYMRNLAASIPANDIAFALEAWGVFE